MDSTDQFLGLFGDKMTNHGQGTWHLEHCRNLWVSIGMELRESKKDSLELLPDAPPSTYVSSVAAYSADHCRKEINSMEYVS